MLHPCRRWQNAFWGISVEKRPLTEDEIDEIRKREKSLHPEASIDVHPFTDEEGNAIIVIAKDFEDSDP